jgi:hypothetical protein
LKYESSMTNEDLNLLAFGVPCCKLLMFHTFKENEIY